MTIASTLGITAGCVAGSFILTALIIHFTTLSSS